MHALLAAQIKQFCRHGDTDVVGLGAAVNAAYVDYDGQLEELRSELEASRAQLLHADRLASIGQVAVGVAHEINSPLGFVCSNVGTMQDYLNRLLGVVRLYEASDKSAQVPDALQRMQTARAGSELATLRRDIPELLAESKEGIARVRRILQDVTSFARADNGQQWQWTDLHLGIDAALNIAASEIRQSADVVREYGVIPRVRCLPMQLNQVVMNLLVNAAHALSERRGTITVRTGTEGADVWMSVSDTGAGIAPEHLPHIFDPFFTTKEAGKGTGLGLSLAQGIVARHRGRIDVDSRLGCGTTFRVVLPANQPDSAAALA